MLWTVRLGHSSSEIAGSGFIGLFQFPLVAFRKMSANVDRKVR